MIINIILNRYSFSVNIDSLIKRLPMPNINLNDRISVVNSIVDILDVWNYFLFDLSARTIWRAQLPIIIYNDQN